MSCACPGHGRSAVPEERQQRDRLRALRRLDLAAEVREQARDGGAQGRNHGRRSLVRAHLRHVRRLERRGVVRPVRRAEARGQQRRRREDSAHPLGELAPPAAVCEGEGRPGGEGGRLRRPQLARRPPDEDSAA